MGRCSVGWRCTLGSRMWRQFYMRLPDLGPLDLRMRRRWGRMAMWWWRWNLGYGGARHEDADAKQGDENDRQFPFHLFKCVRRGMFSGEFTHPPLHV